MTPSAIVIRDKAVGSGQTMRIPQIRGIIGLPCSLAMCKNRKKIPLLRQSKPMSDSVNAMIYK